jgi:hypothetical protein
MPTRAQINKAIDQIRKQKVRNISEVARRNNLLPSTLNRHWNGVISTTQDEAESSLKLLTKAQEAQLIDQINISATRGLHMTPRILRTIVEDLIQDAIGSTWAYDFLHRYSDIITSRYLKGYERERKITDNPTFITHFYTNVSSLSS